MLSFCNHHGKQGRREFLRVGGLALGGLTLPGLLSLQAQAAGSGTLLKNKSVIFLFMHGGPSQIETFDPKMTAPSGIHSVTGEVATKIPGVTFGGTFPRLAQLADRMSIVRSYRSGDSRHDIKPVVHKDTLNANLGSLYSRVVGANHPENGMPTNAVLFPQAIDDKMLPAVTQFGKFDSHGLMGSAYAPFVPGAGGDMQSNMSLSISPNRLDDRRLLLSKLDRARWAAEKSETFAASSQLQRQAFDVILGGVSKAFDLSEEDPRVVARYDTAPLVKPASISTRWKNYKRYIDNAQSLGKLLLMARRLCEAGCGFVTITTNFVWDMHADKNNAGVGEGMDYMGVPFDHAVSAFMEDVHAASVMIFCWSVRAKWDALPNSTVVADAITGAIYRLSCCQAAVSTWGRSLASQTDMPADLRPNPLNARTWSPVSCTPCSTSANFALRAAFPAKWSRSPPQAHRFPACSDRLTSDGASHFCSASRTRFRMVSSSLPFSIFCVTCSRTFTSSPDLCWT